ncbi:sugar phosphate isomerase/epimerase family protein [Haloarchaeobius sp. TZWSO28]|uniref:sugar phosphate isomerase/epimerase family protein n=1 Tax=Haloarchaeobius sp. TZWSO28 TaxID=3446119 RepID=UPI003EBD4F44
MVDTAINLYSVRELDEPMFDIIDRVAAAGYDGVQFSGGFRDATAAETATRIEDHGLGVAPSHVGINELEDEFEEVLADHRDTLGCTGGVVPWLGPGDFESAAAVDDAADRILAVADRCAEHDWDLHYHNHAHEFVDLGDETAFERFVRKIDPVSIELDVGWALVGGVDPADFIRKHGDRIDVLHMKDMDVETEDFREIGDGDVDMAACAQAAHDVGVEWLVYEHDQPADPATSIDTGGAFLSDLK